MQQLAGLCCWEIDHAADVVHLQEGDCKFLGRTAGWRPTPLEFWQMVEPQERAQIDAQLKQAFAAKAPEVQFEHGLTLAHGLRHLRCNVRLEHGHDGQPKRALGVYTDVTEARQLERSAHARMFYNPVTKLPNRELFLERLGVAVSKAHRTKLPVAIAILNLDNFRKINDCLGHRVGDELLRAISTRLTAGLRDYDTIAHLGSDEFSIIFPEIRHMNDLGVVAGKLCGLLHQPCSVDGNDIVITASIGISVFPNDGDDAELLIQHADAAMHQAKNKGRDGYQFYAKDLTEKAHERLSLEFDLRRVLEREELVLHYQPKVDMRSGAVMGAEALMRWNHPHRGMIPPDQFIGIAEDTGLIVGMGTWALMNACSVARAWNDRSTRPLKMAVNVSSRQIYGGDLCSTVQAALEITGCRPEWLELEITESLLLGSHEDIRGNLRTLHELGVTIAIDDFGTGFSSLNYLTLFPISTLKIDRTFVRSIGQNEQMASLIRTIATLGHSLKMELVAEGVETEAQADFLRDVDCQLAQGWLYGRPVPQALFEERLAPATVDAGVHSDGLLACIDPPHVHPVASTIPATDQNP
jgi:diguanylate cyclase (GGDEF)-like protein